MSNPHQRTEEWFKEREGKLTASMFGAAAGLGPGSRQQAWRRILGVEVFTGNEATEWGEAMEPVALAAYRNHHPDHTVDLCGFVKHKSLDWLGCSPDLLISGIPGLGMGEIKCPFSKTLYDEIPPHYMAQMQGQMQIADRNWCDFIVWTPEAMSVTTVFRSNEYWDWLHLRLADFWTWVVAQVEPPREKKVPLPQFNVEIGETRIFHFQPT